ncbi:MAG: hypothetical protein J6T92_05580 [Ottowia sp.]|nr:hypothetical protein [Ottowia sp.]
MNKQAARRGQKCSRQPLHLKKFKAALSRKGCLAKCFCSKASGVLAQTLQMRNWHGKCNRYCGTGTAAYIWHGKCNFSSGTVTAYWKNQTKCTEKRFFEKAC